LPDVNVLIALVEPEHAGHQAALKWHRKIAGSRLFLCAVTESGFVRLTASPHVGGQNMEVAIALLREIEDLPNCAHLPILQSWLELVAPFATRLHGYRQVTDALLLGLAIENNSILVTLDRRIEALAGSEFQEHVLTLQ
jgi:uncharacterized protein